MDVRGFRWGRIKIKSKAGEEVGGRRWGMERGNDLGG